MTLLSLKTEHFILESNFACSLEQHCHPPPPLWGAISHGPFTAALGALTARVPRRLAGSAPR